MPFAGACYPDYSWSVEEARYQDGKWDHSKFLPRFHPDRYWFDLWVLPESRLKGHRNALHEAAVKALRDRNALAATAGVKESMTDGVEFTKKRGWGVVKRFAGANERVTAQGVLRP